MRALNDVELRLWRVVSRGRIRSTLAYEKVFGHATPVFRAEFVQALRELRQRELIGATTRTDDLYLWPMPNKNCATDVAKFLVGDE